MSRNRKSAKAAGARMEQAVADYLAWALTDRRVERRHLSGSQDRGDITGVMLDGERVCIEVKNTSRSDVSAHLAEAQTEAGNDDAVFWAVVQKRHGVGIDSPLKVGQQLVVMTLNQYATILNHGVPLGEEMES